MGRNRLVDLISKLSEEQVDRLSGIAMEYLELNTEFENTTPKSCPCCSDTDAHFIKRGFSGRKQRYQCKSCGKRFTFDAGKLTAYSHQTEGAWATFIRDTLSLKSLDECAANISVSHPTSFYMRHKLLSFLEEAIKDTELLEGVIEADEAYVLESQKGIPVTTRKPRKHGETATKRGLSDEHFCVCSAADRDGRIVVRCVNRGNPSAEDIEEAFSARISESGVFLCDGKMAYNKLIHAKKCEKIVLKSHQDYNRAYHLNTVNGLHSRLKDMLYRYRGVSSKYLNRYLALFTALEQARHSVFHPEVDSIRQLIAGINAVNRIHSLQKEGILAL